MIKHIFLEGNIRQGKSTLLRNVLAPYMSDVGGFASQRLVNSDGTTLAFRIGPAADTPLSAPYTNDVQGGVNGVFRTNTPDGAPLKNHEIFDTDGVYYLKNNDGKRIILLDEIGGIELLRDKFCAALFECLKGDIPCIGVIKRYENADYMMQTIGYNKELVQRNLDLRKKLTDCYDAKILEFKRDKPEVKEELEKFLCGIFMTN